MAPKINEETINQFISIFNTEIEKIADWINERIPVDSVLRKPTIKRALDFFSAWVEGRAKNNF